jgi:hypothetical protein
MPRRVAHPPSAIGLLASGAKGAHLASGVALTAQSRASRDGAAATLGTDRPAGAPMQALGGASVCSKESPHSPTLVRRNSVKQSPHRA